ncbi:hypothetical protein J5N97_028034 [Dioscorea zingiberensis]|uniref:Helicase ATP-binding domain-containing protein n=1 Tax=Dioscorea zingiberensis TaxID=325984 RepID=A0A9D5H4E4_9LILI|nr:hypothetical protein J5N97_028034 [Dioscorea zingiberensis]
MAAAEATVEKPERAFPAFPFEPYPIQREFMAFLYESLDKGGTGKTLSIICSSLQWLVDQRSNPKPDGQKPVAADDAEEEPDWMRDFVVESVEKKEIGRRRSGFGLKGSDKEKSSRGLRNAEKPKEEFRNGDDDDAEFLLEDYKSEEECEGFKRKGRRCSDSKAAIEEEVTPKIYFTSRTHSQLSQFVKEFKRTSFASEINLVCLGSRKNLCINPEITKLGTANRINERCLELQKNKKSSKVKVGSDGGRMPQKKTSSGCPMLKKQSSRELFRDEFRKQGALDIEDLVKIGSKYGTSDLVVLPYQSLLLSSARKSLGLNLKRSVIIVDEAHNLADSLTSMYNAKITSSQLMQVHSHLELYFDRFRNHLGPANRRYIQTLIALTRSFIRLFTGGQNDSEEQNCCESSMTINDFLFSLDIDNINLVKLHQYVKESNISHKVSGYGLKLISSEGLTKHDNDQNLDAEGSLITGFQALVDILVSLINNDSDGRIIISRQKPSCKGLVGEGYLKFVMLSGEKIFHEITDQAHAVVLAGGTLQPIEESRVRLFPDLSVDQVHFFSCDHIVPPESILPIVVSRGPSGMTFDFSYNSRGSPSMIEELGRLLCNLVAVIPEGIVVFFSSFDYEGQVYDAWKASGILPRILKKKRLFREPRNNTEVEVILKEYQETITLSSFEISKVNPGPQGALLLAVVGGKVSEGINFSDGMGRCIVMVGLPYPSPSDVELMERVKHIEGLGGSLSSRHIRPLPNISHTSNSIKSGFEILRSCKQRGKEYYENLCMKAVNQSIGRAIRHINDYAAVLLVDSRYAFDPSTMSSSHPSNKLPRWIKQRLVSSSENYGEVHRLLHQFFKSHKGEYK